MKFLLFLLAVSPISLIVAEDAVAEFIAANNLFTPAIYKQILKTNPENFLVSPLSAEIALALTHSGAKEETAAELQKALFLPDDNQKIEDGVKGLLPKLRENVDYTLHTANKLYIKENFQINENFKRVATNVFQAESENVDFTKSTEASARINKWVEEQTENRIKNLVSSGDLDELTRAVIVNALYFKADWARPFIPSTRKAKFYKIDGSDVVVDTMHSRYGSWFQYFECHHLNAQLVELPFKNRDASLVIVLPNEKTGISSLETQLDMVFAPHNFTSKPVNVNLPKFKIESEIDFIPILGELGVSKAFDAEHADLSGIAGKKGELIIDKVKQKAFIDVNEEGVEAAAATHAIIAIPTSGLLVSPKQFTADHPFIFYIKVKDLVIFAGRVTVPNQ